MNSFKKESLCYSFAISPEILAKKYQEIKMHNSRNQCLKYKENNMTRKITISLNENDFNLIFEVIEQKYYEAIDKLEKNIEVNNYNLKSFNVNRVQFEKDICEYAKWTHY